MTVKVIWATKLMAISKTQSQEVQEGSRKIFQETQVTGCLPVIECPGRCQTTGTCHNYARYFSRKDYKLWILD